MAWPEGKELNLPVRSKNDGSLSRWTMAPGPCEGLGRSKAALSKWTAALPRSMEKNPPDPALLALSDPLSQP